MNERQPVLLPKKHPEVFRVQGINPDTGHFTEVYTNSADHAKRLADILCFGEIRLNKFDLVVYRDGQMVVSGLSGSI